MSTMKISRYIICALILFLMLDGGGFCGEIRIQSKKGNVLSSPLRELKKTVVFLGKLDASGKPHIHATGFLVDIDGVFYLLTAKHVVFNTTTGEYVDKDLMAFFNLKDGGVTIRSITEIKDKYEVDWVFHSDPDVDIAMIPFMLDVAEEDVRVVKNELFLSSEELFELYDVFFLSYQPGIELKGRITPIIRSGTISLLEDDGTFYLDAAAFPGNTGSPVFLKPSPIRYNQSGYTIGTDPLGGRFIGIIGEYVPYQEVAVSAQTGRPRIVFEENTGLSRVWSVSFIKEIVESETFKSQFKWINKDR